MTTVACPKCRYPRPFPKLPPTCPGCGWSSTLEPYPDDDERDFSEATRGCPTCLRFPPGSFAPSHDGSRHCESGSIASGGKIAHCSCELCF